MQLSFHIIIYLESGLDFCLQWDLQIPLHAIKWKEKVERCCGWEDIVYGAEKRKSRISLL